MKDDADFEAALRDTLPGRAMVDEAEVQRLRASIAGLPQQRRGRHRGALLGIAAGIVVMLGIGGLLFSPFPIGMGGAAPNAPDPAAYESDPRLTVCGLTSKDADAIFEMAHVRDYPLHLPAAYPLVGLQADPEAPALVIIRTGPASGDREGHSPSPQNHDLCMVVGADAASWAQVDIVDVDTKGLVAVLPRLTGPTFAPGLAPWADRCGGGEAGILNVFTFDHGTDVEASLALNPPPPELATDEKAAVIVYLNTQPFAPLGTPPADGVTVAPREPLAADHYDICVLVGADAGVATRTIHENVAVGTGSGLSPTTDRRPRRRQTRCPPAQVDPADCRAMRFTDARCLAVIERARSDAGLSWTDVQRVSLAVPSPDSGLSLGGGGSVASVTFALANGTDRHEEVRCLGIGGQYSLVCTENPEIQLSSGVNRDVPCIGDAAPGDPGSACATPLPAVEPSAEKGAVPLEIHSTDIPITSVGHKEIDMGRATIPNGVLSESTFTLADIHTRTFQVEDGIRLEVRSHDPSRPPFDNVYAHGWYPGTEDVEVYLVMDVTSFTPGAMLQVRDLVVR